MSGNTEQVRFLGSTFDSCARRNDHSGARRQGQRDLLGRLRGRSTIHNGIILRVWFEIGFDVCLDDARFSRRSAPCDNVLARRSHGIRVAGLERCPISFGLRLYSTSYSTFLHENPPRIGFGRGSRERVLVLGQEVFSLAGSLDGCPRPFRPYWFLLHISGP